MVQGIWSALLHLLKGSAVAGGRRALLSQFLCSHLDRHGPAFASFSVPSWALPSNPAGQDRNSTSVSRMAQLHLHERLDATHFQAAKPKRSWHLLIEKPSSSPAQQVSFF